MFFLKYDYCVNKVWLLCVQDVINMLELCDLQGVTFVSDICEYCVCNFLKLCV